MAAQKTMAAIKVSFRTADRYSESRSFATLEGARAYAQKKIGETPEIGTDYAVSPWGDATIRVRGTFTVDGAERPVLLIDLFPRTAPPKPEPCPADRWDEEW